MSNAATARIAPADVQPWAYVVDRRDRRLYEVLERFEKIKRAGLAREEYVALADCAAPASAEERVVVPLADVVANMELLRAAPTMLD